ncbi:Methyltransferase domain-containing protein [Thermoactinomyces sp. DSM 45891]|uniref:methyltransferase n=1 Tax=Thermoactinomyces sp. DSM 45891 TaxID=1761907 RepID=UPI00091F9935|nr:methyltransferase [Thermoactinomyces sp. DSM 45891]SFX79087.1 Methyltransferase domain-containing protein [Thermoactinomyces sp. DSM 45891]
MNTQASKLRELATGLTRKIQHLKSPDRLTNTRRRLGIAIGMMEEADKLEHLQKVMLSIAESIEDGTAVYLKRIKNRTQVEMFISETRRIKRLQDSDKPFYYYSEQNNSYRDTDKRNLTMEEIITHTKMPSFECGIYRITNFMNDLDVPESHREDYARVQGYIELSKNDNYIDLLPVRKEMEKLLSIGKQQRHTQYETKYMHSILMKRKRLEAIGIQSDKDFREALIEFMGHLNDTKKSKEQRRIEQIKIKEKEIAHRKIPGYFPTPEAVVEVMIHEADICDEMKVLEPSAGAGHIADQLVELDTGADVIEINYSLRELLKEKGHHIVGEDFLQFHEKNKYDRIIMNPPFEKGQDAEHIRHAYNLVKPGGKVIALASEGPFFRQDQISRNFRDFLEQNDGYTIQLPPNSFLSSDRSTGVNIRLVVLEKPSTPEKRHSLKDVAS